MSDANEKVERSTARDLTPTPLQPPPGRLSKYEKSWAVLIGIDKYEVVNPLSHAVNDACAVARRLIDKFEFPADNVFMFVDHATDDLPAALRARCRPPTKDGIEKLLLDELPKMLGPDDRLVLFFAGHGEPHEIEGSDQKDWYMVPIDGRRSEWSTLIDIDQIFKALNRSKAKHVLYILDACFSGIAGENRGPDDRPVPFREQMLSTRARQGISAASPRQVAADRGQGGKNSLFTEYLLKGLDGEANAERLSSITASELAHYVKHGVAAATESQQKPEPFTLRHHEVGGDFVFDVPRFFLTAPERVRLAGLLVEELGLGREEVAPLWFAKALLDQEGGELTPEQIEEAKQIRRRLRYGLRRLGGMGIAGQVSPAERPLPEERVFEALTAFKRGERKQAAEVLRALAEDDRGGEWGAIAEWVLSKLPAGGRSVAVLVGISNTANGMRKLEGPKNDIEALRRLLAERLGFEEIVCLHDATANAVVDKLNQLASTLTDEDRFLFYFAGNGQRIVPEDLVVYVFHDAAKPENGKYEGPWDEAHGYLTEGEMDRLLRAIPAQDKLVITDGCHLAPRQGLSGYQFLAACGRDETCTETKNPDGTIRGAFSFALEKALAEHPTAPLDVIMRRVDAAVRERFPRQHAVVADAESARQPLVKADGHALDLLDLAARPDAARGHDRSQVERLLDEKAPPAMWLAVAHAYALRKEYWNAKERALRHVPVTPGTARWHVELCAGAGDYAAAVPACSSWAGAAPAPIAARLRELAERLSVAGKRTKRALLVSDAMFQARKCESWLRALGFAPENITWLHPDPTNLSADELRAAFRRLVASPEDPALFVLERAGRTITGGGDRWEEGTDLGHLPPPGELAALASGHRALTCLLSTSLKPDLGAASPRVGTLTIWVGPGVRERELSLDNPSMFQSLMEALRTDGVWRVDQWVAAANLTGDAEIVGDPKARLFEHPDDARDITRLLREIIGAPLAEAVSLLGKMKHQPTAAGEEALLFLGATLLAQGRPEDALQTIDEAIRLREQRAKEGHDKDVKFLSGNLIWPAAHFYRGQALLALPRPQLGQAVDAFTVAAEQSPDDPVAHYHRAVAIQRLIDEDLATQAQKARDAYDLRYAPLGPIPRKENTMR